MGKRVQDFLAISFILGAGLASVYFMVGIAEKSKGYKYTHKDGYYGRSEFTNLPDCECSYNRVFQFLDQETRVGYTIEIKDGDIHNIYRKENCESYDGMMICLSLPENTENGQ